jgi:hypothetical protein
MTPWIFAPVVAAVLSLGASPAHPASELSLAIHPGSGNAAAVSLLCQPSGGTHPDPAGACNTLSMVDGDFDKVPHESTLCPDIYAPVTATASGHWRNRPVEYTHTYANSCLAAADSARIFTF